MLTLKSEMAVLECHIMILIMLLVGHQWLVDGGEGKDFQTMYCVDFLQIILCEKLMDVTTAVNLTLAARKMKNLPSQLVLAYVSISSREHQACR